MNTITRGIPTPPQSVGGTGATAKLFGSTLNICGSGRLTGRKFKVVGSGSAVTTSAINVSVQVAIAPPTGKYPAATITAAVLADNVASYTAKNNFKAGGFVTVAGCSTGALNFTTAKKIASANGTVFTVAITNANVASENESGAAATIAATPILSGNTVSVNGTAPFSFDVECTLDSAGNLQSTVKDSIGNTVADAEQAGANEVTGLDGSDEPVGTVAVSVTFGTSDANNAATLNKFDLEA